MNGGRVTEDSGDPRCGHLRRSEFAFKAVAVCQMSERLIEELATGGRIIRSSRPYRYL